MNNKRATKRALLTSVMALVMCVVMLVGTTFAWFTDTASTGVNKIVSGNLKVDIVGATTGKHIDSLSFQNKDNSSSILWEPGVTFHTEGFRIKNDGNLALKWKMVVNKDSASTGVVEGSNGKAGMNLLDVIDFSVVSSKDENAPAVKIDEFVGHTAAETIDSVTYYIKGTMKTTAGNDYQDLTLDGITITVYATQDTVEFDSFDDKYDEGATLPEIRTVTDAATIADSAADLATAGNKNVVVSVAQDMNNTAGIKTAKGNTLTMDLNGKSVGVSYGQGSTNTTTNGMQLLQGSTVTLKNGTYKANHGNDADHNIAILIQNYSNLTIENCTLDMREANDTAGNSKGTSYALSTNCGKVVIKGETNIYARNNTEYALDVMHWENPSYKDEGTSVTFDETMTGTVDGKIDVYCYRNSRVVKPVDDGGATLTIMGGTFVNSGLTLEQFKAFVPAGYTVTETNGSFTVSK
jgi:predicted ribosomally synthesized peptide with SipW-like signal peptide